MCSFLIINPSTTVRPKQFQIDATSSTKRPRRIGRSKEKSDIVFRAKKSDNPLMISRLHAIIYKNDLNEWILVDKGSKNGCFVNGYKILQQQLNHGDTVVFGGGSMLMTGSYQDNVDSQFAYTCCISKNITKDDVVGKNKKVTALPSKRRRKDTKPSSTHEPSAKVKRKKISDISEEFICPICLDFFVHAQALGCGHSFCASCLASSLANKLQCPACNRPALHKPSRSFVLDNVVARLLAHDTDATARWQARKKEYEHRVEHQRIVATKLTRKTFKALALRLDVLETWTPQQQNSFRSRLVLYEGPARAQYCKSVKLTTELVDTVTIAELNTVAANVRVKWAPQPCADDADYVSLRDRLNMFIYYG